MEFSYMNHQTLYKQLESFRYSNPIFTADNYTLQYLNTIADILLLQQPSTAKIEMKKNGKKETATTKPNKLEKAVRQ